MADPGEKAAKQLREITECPICMSAFKDPRMLPCIHTFCFACLNRTAEAAEMKPGDRMPCPVCRKDFFVPGDGVNGLQKNFFMENLLEFKTTLQIWNAIIICDMCRLCTVRNDSKTGDIGLPNATMRCLECQDNYCDSCVKFHQTQKLSRNHQLVKLGNETASEMKRPIGIIGMHCSQHTQKPLDYYCADCKKIVCVSCFVESHASHKCKDVTTVEEEFRKTIQMNSSKVSSYADEILYVRKNAEIRKADFLKEIVDKENSIHKRNRELKDMIDDHTQSLLDELSVIKSKHLKEIETGMQEIDRCCTMLRSFEAYCTELISKGSASDICSSIDQLIVRAGELEGDHEAFICRPHQSVEVSFQATDLGEIFHNFLGQVILHVKEATLKFENFAFVVGINYGSMTLKHGVVKINLHRPNEISTHGQIPTIMRGKAAAVYCNTMYVSGLGNHVNEIWKYNMASGWVKCASLLDQGRIGHCSAFVDDVLYICGGVAAALACRPVQFSVEAFNAVTDECNTVGQLVHGIRNSGNCVPFRSSLYIFGGIDSDGNRVSHIQMYDTKQNTCTLLTTPMPIPSAFTQAVLWETSAILVGENTCFIFDFEKETLQERKQFKAGFTRFGLVLHDGKVFVIGGGDVEADFNWKLRDDVRYVPLQNILKNKSIAWKIHGKLPKPSLVEAFAEMRMIV